MASDPRIAERLTQDRRASADLDPLDQLDRETSELMWAQEGSRLLEREDSVRGWAVTQGLSFRPLDAVLSGRLVASDVLEGCPRVTRNVCEAPGADGLVVTDLTGALFRHDGVHPVDLHLRTATACLFPFPTAHRLAIVPAGEDADGWDRFGSNLPTESAEFDARHHVYADDPAWALIVLNPAMLVRLTDHTPITVVISGDTLAVLSTPWVPAPDLTDFQRFAEQVNSSARSARG